MKNVMRFKNTLLRGMKTTTGKVRTFISAVAANTLQIVGLAVIASGFFVLALWLGLIVAGLMIALIGWAIDK